MRNHGDAHALRTLVSSLLGGGGAPGRFSLGAVALVPGWRIQRTRTPRLRYDVRRNGAIVHSGGRAKTETYLRDHWLWLAILESDGSC